MREDCGCLGGRSNERGRGWTSPSDVVPMRSAVGAGVFAPPILDNGAPPPMTLFRPVTGGPLGWSAYGLRGPNQQSTLGRMQA